jgi:hypothetical protein
MPGVLKQQELPDYALTDEMWTRCDFRYTVVKQTEILTMRHRSPCMTSDSVPCRVNLGGQIVDPVSSYLSLKQCCHITWTDVLFDLASRANAVTHWFGS